MLHIAYSIPQILGVTLPAHRCNVLRSPTQPRWGASGCLSARQLNDSSGQLTELDLDATVTVNRPMLHLARMLDLLGIQRTLATGSSDRLLTGSDVVINSNQLYKLQQTLHCIVKNIHP